jgi:PhzF family phenazine biosynthesis protein
MARRFLQIDVFTDQPLCGNPLGVVLDAAGLDTAAMQRFTDWMNLSECSFLLPPTPEGAAAGADYRVRIFCPGLELPFAGHPTLGSARAWLQAGGRPRTPGALVQECGVGLVRLRLDDGPAPRLWFAAPPLRRSGALDAQALARATAALGLAPEDVRDAAWCDNGPPWQALLLRSAAAVRALRPDPVALQGLFLGVAGPQAPGAATAFEVRAFFPKGTAVAEDPVTGSLNAGLAQWLMAAGLAPEHCVVAQGTALGRAGRVHLHRDGQGTVWVGGDTVICIEGHCPW